MSPGVVGITLFEAQLEEMMHDPSGITLALLAVILTALLFFAAMLRRWLRPAPPLPSDKPAPAKLPEHCR
jgi:predicted RND superfamily exporter protein